MDQKIFFIILIIFLLTSNFYSIISNIIKYGIYLILLIYIIKIVNPELSENIKKIIYNLINSEDNFFIGYISYFITTIKYYFNISSQSSQSSQSGQSSNIPVVSNKSSNIPIVPNKSSNIPVVSNKSSNIPVVSNKSSNIPVVSNKSSNIPVVSNKSSNIPVVSNKSSNQIKKN